MTGVLATPETQAAIEPRAQNRAKHIGISTAAVLAVAVSTRSGLGLALAVAAASIGAAVAVGPRTSAGVSSLALLALAPWLVIRDNTWLAMCIVATAFAVLGLSSVAAATKQSAFDFSVSALSRRVEGESPEEAPAIRTAFAVLRGLVLAVPIVGLFWVLLATADDVFASLVNPESVPLGRVLLFAMAAPTLWAWARFAGTGRNTLAGSPSPWSRFLGPIESSIVLSAVSLLFLAFVSLRIATLGRELSEEAWRSEVRSGFFQLLWVAALTVMLVLAIRRLLGSEFAGRVRNLAWLAVALATAIDVLALVRIGEYVARSFWSPLRFWSFGFGVWLLVILGTTAFRLSEASGPRRWFTLAALGSWMAFLLVFAVINPDARIAQHTFDNAPTGEDEWIAVKPLMWLSEDATPIIVQNINVLRPMPNDRYDRVEAHLCSQDFGDSWRDLHFSRNAAADALTRLC